MAKKIEDNVFDDIGIECVGIYGLPFENANVNLIIYESGKGDFNCKYLLPRNFCDNLKDEYKDYERKKCPYAGILKGNHS